MKRRSRIITAVVLCVVLYTVGAGGSLALFRAMGMDRDRDRYGGGEVTRTFSAAFWPVTVPIYLLARGAEGVADAVVPE